MMLRCLMPEWLDALAIFTLDLYSVLGIHCVVEMDLFSEFAITVTVPIIGLLLIFLMYHGRLRCESTRAAGSDGTRRDDPEQVDGSTEQHALLGRSVEQQKYKRLGRRWRFWRVFYGIRSLLLQSPKERNPQAEPKWTCLSFVFTIS